ncbi:TadE/TadG family type IV pilus assembly protein [Nocardioides yefusunii]|uniref:TadE/TadG family type IV pilus assembly protein n=1 Tax=Nocardioides yefusunii TaxID=2500546 RepID=A0ABW1QSW6_9ACTN|nr:TadE/TadG family type IV pilus assembly protein [Nocardioides yefusunii]
MTRDERGSAVVDFVLVLLLLLPLVVGILQLALVMHVRNVLSSAAAEGARHAALSGATPRDGVETARRQWEGAVSDSFVRSARVESVDLDGASGYRLVLDVEVPALGLGGPAVAFEVTGSAVREWESGAA